MKPDSPSSPASSPQGARRRKAEWRKDRAGPRAVDRPASVNGVPVPGQLSVPELIARLHPPGPEAWAACLALGRVPGRESLEELQRLLRDPDWRYRRTAVEAVSTHPDARSLGPTIVAMLSDSSQFVVRSACDAVAYLLLAEAHAPVVGLLDSPEAATRAKALSVLVRLWIAEDFPHVFLRFQSDPDEEVRREAAWTLRHGASEGTWRTLFTVWIHGPLARYRIWACELALEFGVDEVKGEIHRLLDDADGHVRRAARRALGFDSGGPA